MRLDLTRGRSSPVFSATWVVPATLGFTSAVPLSLNVAGCWPLLIVSSTYRVAPPKVSHYIVSKNRIKTCLADAQLTWPPLCNRLKIPADHTWVNVWGQRYRSCVPSLEYAFSHAGPAAWNSLPEHIRAEPDICVFRKLLKTNLYNIAFNVHWHSGFYSMWLLECTYIQLHWMMMVLMPLRLDFFVKLKQQSSTIILSVGNKYFIRDLLCDVINNGWPAK